MAEDSSTGPDWATISGIGFLDGDDVRADLAGQVRKVINELVASDADSTAFAMARDLVGEAARVLATGARQRTDDQPAEASLLDLSKTRLSAEHFDQSRPTFLVFSPFSGVLNPASPPIELTLTDDGVTGTVTYSRVFEGPPGCVHGGVVAGGFDEVLGFIQANSDRPGMTARLTINYRRPTPLNVPLRYQARIASVEGRKLFASCELSIVETGAVCAEAEGLFIAIQR